VGLIVVERARRSSASASASAFTKREKRTLEAFASAFVDAWAIHRNGVIALGATYRANETVGGYLYESRRPLTALRTLGGMLKTYLKPDDPAGDMAEALVRQGDALAELSAKLESALYPSKSAAERGALYNNGGGGVMDRGTTRLLANADARADALVAASRDEMCDVTKVAVALLASSDVVASSEGVVTRARLPETDGPSRTVVYANPMDVRSALAQVIDVALMSSPRDAVVDVCVCEASADGFVDVEVNVDTSNVSLSIEARMSERTPGLRIAKRLVERAGGEKRRRARFVHRSHSLPRATRVTPIDVIRGITGVSVSCASGKNEQRALLTIRAKTNNAEKRTTPLIRDGKLSPAERGDALKTRASRRRRDRARRLHLPK